MKSRCLNPRNHAFADYGGRGITVCPRWQGEHGFENFLKDMGKRPKGTSIDRINNDGNYELSNCRWATQSEQNHNQRPKLTMGNCRPLDLLPREILEWERINKRRFYPQTQIA